MKIFILALFGALFLMSGEVPAEEASEYTRAPRHGMAIFGLNKRTQDFANLFPVASSEVRRTVEAPFDVSSDETLLKLEDPVQVIVGSSRGTTSYLATFGNYSDAVLSVTSPEHKRFLAVLLLSMPHWKIPLTLDIDKEGRVRKADFYPFLWQDRVHEFWANPKFKLCLSITFGSQEDADSFVAELKGESFQVSYGSPRPKGAPVRTEGE